MTDKSDHEANVLALARAAGLDRMIAEFRDDLLAAERAAADARASFTATDDAAVEPWPPMKTGGA